MAVTGPTTGYQYQNTQTGVVTDLGNYFVSKDYMLDVYPNLVPGRTSPGLYACGYNVDYGQLGIGNTVNYSSPVQVGSLTNWKYISPGSAHSLAIKTDGTLWAWGSNSSGQLGIGNTVNYSSPVQVGSLTDWKQVAGSDDYGRPRTLAIKTNRTLWVWGNNDSGVLGIGNTVNYSSPVQVGSSNNWRQVSCGNSYAAAVTTDGKLWSWGDTTLGGSFTLSSTPVQVGALTNWSSVECGYTMIAAIKTDGTLWAISANDYGQLGNNTIGIWYSSPVQIGSLTGWKQVSCGYAHTSAIRTDGTLWAWGANDSGQLGLNNSAWYSSPVQVGALTNWKSVVVSTSVSTMAIKTDGTLWGWGYNVGGELGIGNIVNYSSPVQVGSLTSWKTVGAGTYHSMAISDGYL